MRQVFTSLFAVFAFLLVPGLATGQDNAASKTWPRLGSAETIIYEGQPRFIIQSDKLEKAQSVSNPLAVTRCLQNSPPCIVRMLVTDFFSEWKGNLAKSVLRPDVMLHHYPHALFEWHYQATGTYVFYLPKHKAFYLWGDCAMGHADELAGPFAGDPRVVLKKLVDDPEAVARLGFLLVPVAGLDSPDEVWPAITGSGIDTSKLERAQNGLNPLALDRCRASSEECVLTMQDFSLPRRNHFGKDIWTLRRGVKAHYYPGLLPKYTFHLPSRNIFYIAVFERETNSYPVLGPFRGDPRLELKKVGNAGTN